MTAIPFVSPLHHYTMQLCRGSYISPQAEPVSVEAVAMVNKLRQT